MTLPIDEALSSDIDRYLDRRRREREEAEDMDKRMDSWDRLRDEITAENMRGILFAVKGNMTFVQRGKIKALREMKRTFEGLGFECVIR